MSLRSLLSTDSGSASLTTNEETTTTSNNSSRPPLPPARHLQQPPDAQNQTQPPWFSSSFTGRNTRLRMPSHLLPENQHNNKKRARGLSNSHSSPQLGQLTTQEELLQQVHNAPQPANKNNNRNTKDDSSSQSLRVLEENVQVHVRLEQPAAATPVSPTTIQQDDESPVQKKQQDDDSDSSSYDVDNSDDDDDDETTNDQPQLTNNPAPVDAAAAATSTPAPSPQQEWEPTMDARSVRHIPTHQSFGEFDSVHVVQQQQPALNENDFDEHDIVSDEQDWCTSLTLGLPQHLLQGHSMLVATQQPQHSQSSSSCFQTVVQSLIPQIFQRMERVCQEDAQVTVRLSAVEVYLHHHVTDLLASPQQPEPRLVYNAFQNMAIWQDCTHLSCISADDVLRVCDLAFQRRTHRGAHPSARSTFILQMHVERENTTTIQSTLQLVDLPTRGGHWTALQELLRVPPISSSQQQSSTTAAKTGGLASLARLASFRLPSSHSINDNEPTTGDASSSPESLVGQMLLPSVQGQLLTRVLLSIPTTGDDEDKNETANNNTASLSMRTPAFVTDATIPRATISQMLAVGQAWNRVETISRAQEDTPPLTKWTKNVVQLQEERYTALIQALVHECVRLRTNESKIPKQQKPLWNMIDHIHKDGGATQTLDFQLQSTDTKRQLQQWQATRRMLDKSLEKEMTKTRRLQADLSDLQTQNQALLAQFASLKEELATAEATNAQLVAEANVEKWKLQTATFRESEAVCFLRQYRRFYHRIVQQVTMEGSGALSEIMEMVPGMVPKASDLVDMDRCLLEAGLLEPEELGQFEQEVPLSASRAAMLKSEVQAKLMDKRRNEGNFDAESDVSLSELPRSDRMDIVSMNSEAPQTTSIVAQREAPRQTEARQKAYQTPAGRFICLQEKALEDGVHQVTQKYIQLKTKMLEMDVGDSSGPRLQRPGSFGSEASAQRATANATTKASGGFMSGIFGGPASSAASPNPSYHGDVPAGISDSVSSPDDLSELKKALSKKTSDLHSTVFKMNELLVSAKTYQSKLEDRDQYVVSLEDQLKNAQERLKIIQEDHATLKNQFQSLAQLGNTSGYQTPDPIPLWQMGDGNFPQSSISSRLVVPFTAVHRRQDLGNDSWAQRRRQSQGELEEWSRLALSHGLTHDVATIDMGVQTSIVGNELENEIDRLKNELASEKEHYANEVAKIILGNRHRHNTDGMSLDGDISIDTSNSAEKAVFGADNNSTEAQSQVNSHEHIETTVTITEEPLFLDEESKAFELPTGHTVTRQTAIPDDTSMSDASEMLKERLMGSFEDSMTPSMAGEEDSAAMSGAYGSVRPGEGSSLFSSDESSAFDETETEASEPTLKIPKYADSSAVDETEKEASEVGPTQVPSHAIESSLGGTSLMRDGEGDPDVKMIYDEQKGKVNEDRNDLLESETAALRRRLEEEAANNRKRLEKVVENRKARSEHEGSKDQLVENDKEALRAEMTKLHERIVQMERDDVAATLKAELEEAETNANEAWGKVRRLEDDVAEAEKKARRLEKELADLKNSIMSLEFAKSSIEEKLTLVESERSAMRLEKLDLEKKLDGIARELNLTTIATIEADRPKKRSFLDDSSDDSSDERSNDDSSKNGDNSLMQQPLGNIASVEVLARIQRMNHDSIESEEKVRQLHAENDNLQDDLRDAEEKVRLLEEERIRLMDQLEEAGEAEEKVRLLEDERIRLMDNLEEAGESSDNLAGVRSDKDLATDRIESAETQDANQLIIELKSEVQRMEEANNQLLDDLNFAHSRIARLEPFHDEIRVAESRIAELENALELSRTANANLERDETYVESSSKEVSVPSSDSDNASMRQTEATEEIVVGEEENAAQRLKESEAIINSLQEEVRDLEARVEHNEPLEVQLRKSTEELMIQEARGKTLETDLQESKDVIQQLHEELEEVEASLSQNEALVKQMKESIETLLQLEASAKTKVEVLESELLQSKKKVKNLEQEVNEANEMLAKATEDDTDEQLQEALKKISILETQLEEALEPTARKDDEKNSTGNEDSTHPPIHRALSLSDTVKSPKDIYFANDSSEESDSDESSVAFPRKIMLQLNEAKEAQQSQSDALVKELEAEKQKVSKLVLEKKALEQALLEAQRTTGDSNNNTAADELSSTLSKRSSESNDHSETSSSNLDNRNQLDEDATSLGAQAIDETLMSDILSTDEPMPKPDSIDDNDSISADGLFDSSSESMNEVEETNMEEHETPVDNLAATSAQTAMDSSGEGNDNDSDSGNSLVDVDKSVLADILTTDEPMPKPDTIEDNDSISAEGLFEDSDGSVSNGHDQSREGIYEEQLKSEYSQLGNKYESLMQQIESFENELTKTESKLTDAQVEKSSLVEELENLQQDLEKAQVREVSKLEDSVASMNKTVQGNSDLTLLQKEEERLTEIKESFDRDMLLVEKRIDEKQSEFNDCASRKDDLEKSLQDAKAELEIHASLAKRVKKKSFLDDSSDEDSDSEDSSSDESDDAREIQALEKKITRLKGTMSKLTTEADSALSAIESLEEEKSEISENVSGIELQLQDIHDKLSQVEVLANDDSSSSSDVDPIPGEKSIFELTEEVEKLGENIQQLERTLEDLLSERDNLERELETCRGVRDSLENEKRKLSDALASLSDGSKAKHEEIQSEEDNAIDQVDQTLQAEKSVQVELAALQEERARLQQEKALLKESNEALSSKIRSLEYDLASLRNKEGNEAPQEVDAVFSVAERASDSDSDDSHSESSGDKSGRFESSAPDTKTNDRIREFESEREELESEMIELNDKLLDMESEVEGLEEKLKDAEAANRGLSGRVQTLQSEIVESEAHVKTLEKEKAELTLLVEDGAEMPVSSRAQQYSDDEVLHAEKEDMPQIRATSESSSESSDTDQVEAYQAKFSEMESEMAVLLKDKSKLCEDLDSKTDEANTLREKLSVVEEDAESVRVQLQAAVTALEEATGDFREKLAVSENARNDMMPKIHGLEGELDALSRKLSLSEDQKSDLEGQTKELKAELDSLHQDLMSTEESKLETDDENSELREEVKGLKAKLADRDSYLLDAQNEKENHLNKIEALQQQLADSEKGLRETEKKNNELTSKMALLEKKLVGMERIRDDSEKGLRETEKKNNELASKMELLEKKLVGMERIRDEIMAEETTLGNVPKDQKVLMRKVSLLEKENEILITDLHEVREDTVKLSEGKAAAELSVTQLTLKNNDLQNQLDDIQTKATLSNAPLSRRTFNKGDMDTDKFRSENEFLRREIIDLKKELREAEAQQKAAPPLASIPSMTSRQQDKNPSAEAEGLKTNISMSADHAPNPRKSLVKRLSGRFGGMKASSGHQTSESATKTHDAAEAEKEEQATPGTRHLQTQEQTNPMRIMARRFSAQGLVSRFGGKLKRDGQVDPVTGIKDSTALLDSEDPDLEYDQELARKELREKLQKREDQINEKGAVVIEKFGESAPKDYGRTVFGETIKKKKIVKPKGVAEVAEEFEQRKSQSNTPTRSNKESDEEDAAMQEFFSSRAMGGFSQPTPSTQPTDSAAKDTNPPTDAVTAPTADSDRVSLVKDESVEETEESFDPAVLKQRFAAKAAESKPLAPSGSSNVYSSYSGASNWKARKKEDDDDDDDMAEMIAGGRVQAPAPAPAYGVGLASKTTAQEKPQKNISNHKPKSFLDDSSDDDSSDDSDDDDYKATNSNPLVTTFKPAGEEKSFLDDSSDEDDESEDEETEKKPSKPVANPPPKKKSFLDDSSDEDDESEDEETEKKPSKPVANPPPKKKSFLDDSSDEEDDSEDEETDMKPSKPIAKPPPKKKNFLDDSSDEDSDVESMRSMQSGAAPVPDYLKDAAAEPTSTWLTPSEDDEASAPSVASSTKSKFVIRAGKLVQADEDSISNDAEEDEDLLMGNSQRKASTGSADSGGRTQFVIQGGKLVKSADAASSKKKTKKKKGGKSGASNFVIQDGKLVKSSGEPTGSSSNGKPSFKIVGGKLVTGDGPVAGKKKKKKAGGATTGKKKKKGSG